MKGEEDGWVGNSKIDFLRRGFGDIFSILCTTKEDCQVWELDVKKFVRGKCILHYDKDTDGVIMALKKAKQGQKILDIILAFLHSRHDFQDSLKFSRRWLKTKFPEGFAKLL
jgi:hypothetical protein